MSQLMNDDCDCYYLATWWKCCLVCEQEACPVPDIPLVGIRKSTGPSCSHSSLPKLFLPSTSNDTSPEGIRASVKRFKQANPDWDFSGVRPRHAKEGSRSHD